MGRDRHGAWGLKPFKRSTDALSPLAQIAQLPAALEFEVADRPPILHYAGPFVDPGQRPSVDFEWNRLDGRPLVYASLGTMQNGSQPGVAARVAARGAGVVVSRRRLNAKRLSSAVHAVLKNEQYRSAARNLQASMLHMDGLQRAANIVEEALRSSKTLSTYCGAAGQKG